MAFSELGAAVIDTAKEAFKETDEKKSETVKEISGKGESVFPDFFSNLKLDAKASDGTKSGNETGVRKLNNLEENTDWISKESNTESEEDVKVSKGGGAVEIPEKAAEGDSDYFNDSPAENQNGVNENPNLRELTLEEKERLKEIGMSDGNIDKCRIDGNGDYNLKTINEGLEGKKHPITDVPYEKKKIEVNEVKIEGVFPEFDSDFSCILDADNLQGSDLEQFSDCMKKLKEAVDSDPELASKFTPRQLEQIHDVKETNVSGYTWHHNEEIGKMELVKTSDHGPSNHTGGKSIWGGGKEYR